jgi:hypothetical protein
VTFLIRARNSLLLDACFSIVVAMLKQFGKWLVIAALIAMVGGHWAILQTAAWVGMAVSYSKTECIGKALVKTFDGKHPCKLCKLVSAGKQSEKKSEASVDFKKMDLFIPFEKTAFHFVRNYIAPTQHLLNFRSRLERPVLPPPETSLI